jgi:cell division protein FtsZ
MGILTVAVVTKPFPFEGKKRLVYAEQGIQELNKYVDSLITIPNEKLLKVMGKGVPLLQAFSSANDVLRGAVQGIAELITRPGLINVDFADVKTVMSEMGTAMMGSGTATGEDRAEEAAEAAIACPLLEDIDLSGARGILVNITAGPDLAIDEFDTVGNAVKAFASENATVVVGTVIDMESTEEFTVTVVATGLGDRVAADKPELRVLPKQREATPMDLPLQVDEQPVPAKKEVSTGSAKDAKQDAGNDLEYLDIPAFLRKQAD